MGASGDKSGGGNDRKLPPREILKLILATYATSLPYVVLFVVLMLIATWVVTTYLFR